MEITQTRMCQVGQILRHRAVFTNPYINHGEWNAIVDANQLARANMIQGARRLNNSEAFASWQEHYQSCPTCQAALRP